jgi:hypothetical protein
MNVQPKPWLPKSLDKQIIITDLDNAETQPETWEAKKQRARRKRKQLWNAN